MFCCYRPFASLYAVRIHTETHNRQNNLKFSCTMCGASYARAFALKDHMKQVHKKDLNSVDNLVEVTIYRNVLLSLENNSKSVSHTGTCNKPSTQKLNIYFVTFYPMNHAF